MEDDREITNPTDLKESAANHFKNLLTAETRSYVEPNFPFLFPQIPKSMSRELCVSPTLEKVKEVVFSINKDNAARPDGFTSTFYQSCWEFIAKDIWEASKDFFAGTPMPRSTSTIITLIPKIDSPQSWSDFKPIFLCNVTNKIMTKLLYNKLAPLLPTLISPSQNGFVHGRLIGDNILMAQELIL
ncbi:UNVERIFIED_CONTAM: hypothetical protein Slati_0857500 [Sesamum latifolium]|uniref:Reverse transcriptase domain-containing protein n=1 Tax=Sesamum latifolium TaxID=2727402 RepID=A0AAW2XNL6_9LAMI